VIIRGDRLLKCFATRINQFINTKSSGSSYIKPGAFLNQITLTQEYDPRVTEIKEEIVSECVTNDTDNNSDKSDTSVPVISEVNDLKNLGTKDVIILSGGSNDLDHYCGKFNKVLSQLIKFIQLHNNTNILIMSIPHRHDLDKHSMTNLAIKKFNEKLKSLSQRFSHVSIIDTSLNNTTSQDTACT